jgi:NOL1/NOP2/sun family putative RNA methylase
MDKIPSSKKIKLKPKFEERYKKLLGTEYNNFLECSFTYLTKCIRVNTLKTTIKEVKTKLEKNWNLEQIPWSKESFKITPKEGKNYDIGNIKEHSLGYFYVQESASMLPAIVLDPKPKDKVLDMCAAPGSKTTQIAQYMKNEGILIANDLQGSRLKSLGINLQRMGIKNTIETQASGTRFRTKQFDKILVDAPCSGTGTIRKSFKVLEMWSQNLVKQIAKQQYSLLKAGFQALKTEGTLVYSTCTLEPEENETVVSKLLDEFPKAKILPIKLNIKKTKPILKFEELKIRKELKNALRINPQDNNSEGFFICKITKQ